MISSGPVEDRLAIRELAESYNDAVMRFDGDAWKENWLEDAVWSLPGMGDVVGRAKFFPMWQGMMAGFSFVGFYASAGPIVVKGDTAHGTCGSRSSYTARMARSAPDERTLRGRLREARRALVLREARLSGPESELAGLAPVPALQLLSRPASQR